MSRNKTIVTQETPNLAGHPSVNLRKPDFEALIEQKGYNVYLERNYRCPCRSKDGGQQLSSCKNCGGSGYLFINKIKTRMVLHSMNVDTQFKEWSQENIGTVSITARDIDKLSTMDRITLIDAESEFNQVLYPKLLGTDLYAYTTYDIRDVRDVFLYMGDDVPLKRLKNITDYTFSYNKVVLDPVLYNDLVNPTITIRYIHSPQFHVIDIPRETININVKVEGSDTSIQMPINAIGRRSHYVLDQENFVGDRVIDNSYLPNCDDPSYTAFQSMIKNSTFEDIFNELTDNQRNSLDEEILKVINEVGSIHEQNTDTYLAIGTPDETSAHEIRLFLDNPPAGYTDAQARAAISNSATGLSYNSSTGVFSLTSGYVIPTTVNVTSWNSKEPALGNPTVDGYILTSTIAGVRSWVAITSPLTAGDGINITSGVISLDISDYTAPGYIQLTTTGSNRIVLTSANGFHAEGSAFMDLISGGLLTVSTAYAQFSFVGGIDFFGGNDFTTHFTGATIFNTSNFSINATSGISLSAGSGNFTLSHSAGAFNLNSTTASLSGSYGTFLLSQTNGLTVTSSMGSIALDSNGLSISDINGNSILSNSTDFTITSIGIAKINGVSIELIANGLTAVTIADTGFGSPITTVSNQLLSEILQVTNSINANLSGNASIVTGSGQYLTLTSGAQFTLNSLGNYNIDLNPDANASGTGRVMLNGKDARYDGDYSGSYTVRSLIDKGYLNTRLSALSGTVGGFAPLGSDLLISSAYLPSYVDDVLEFANLASFPVTGETGKIYIALDTNKTYRWSGSVYVFITSGAVDSVNGFTGIITLTTSNIAEGSNLYYTDGRFDTRLALKTTSNLSEGSNLYFTNARAIASTLTGYTSGAGTISSSDTILSAIQKLNGNIGALVTGVSAVNLATGSITLTVANTGSSLAWSGVQLQIPTATTSITGLLSSTDWTTFNNKISSQWVTTGSDIYYSTGNVMVGQASAPSAKLHTVDTGTGSPRGIILDQYNDGVNSSQANFRKSRGTFASPTTIVVSDIISNINSWAHDGTSFVNTSSIRVTSVGTIGTGRTPSKMEFYTMTDVSTGVLTLALTLDQAQNALFGGYVGIGITSFSSPDFMLHVADNTSNTLRGVSFDQYGANTGGSRQFFRKARGTYASPTVITTGDGIGNLRFHGYDGASFIESATISVISTGTIATGRVPSQMVFQTMTNTGSPTLTTALTIDEVQKATFVGTVTANLILMPDGSAGNPSYSFTNSTGSGLSWVAASSALAFNVAGTTIFNIKQTTGITLNTGNPALQVGASAAGTDVFGTNLVISAGNGTGGGIQNVIQGASIIFKAPQILATGLTTVQTSTTLAQFGWYNTGSAGSPTNQIGVWLTSSTPASGNYSFLSTSSNLFVNGPSQISFRIAGADVCSIISGGLVAGGSGSLVYKLTNALGNQTAKFIIDGSGSFGAGVTSLSWDFTNGLSFNGANGTSRISRWRAILSNLVNTAGSESSDLTWTPLNVTDKFIIGGAFNLNQLTGTTSRMLEVDSSGNVTGTEDIVAMTITDATIITQLTTGANWTGVVYTGSAIVGATEGQKYKNGTYFYIMDDNTTPIRLARA